MINAIIRISFGILVVISIGYFCGTTMQSFKIELEKERNLPENIEKREIALVNSFGTICIDGIEHLYRERRYGEILAPKLGADSKVILCGGDNEQQ